MARSTAPLDLLRRTVLVTGALLALAADAAVAFPDTPGADVNALNDEALAVGLATQQHTAAARHDEALAQSAAMQEKIAAEMAARLATAADLSLAVVCPWLPEAERVAADATLEALLPDLHQLSWTLAAYVATAAGNLKAAGKEVSAETAARASAYELLVRSNQAANVGQLMQGANFRATRELAAELRRTCLAQQPVDALVARARELPAPPKQLRDLAALTARPAQFPSLIALTADTCALDALYTGFIDADPAHAPHWLARGRVRFERGWRRGAIADLFVATALAPEDPGVAALRELIVAAPETPAGIWQEYVGEDAAIQVTAVRTLSQLANLPPTPAPERHERGARAATRNRARRLYACSFIGDDTQRTAALAWVAARHTLKRTFFPIIPDELGAQFGTDVQAAGNNALAVLKIHNRYAPLFAGTEGFWQRHTNLLAQVGQYPAALAALDAAAQVAPEAGWIASFRSQIQARLAPAAK